MDKNVAYINEQTLGNLQQFLSDEKLCTLLSRYLDDSAGIIEQLEAALANSDDQTTRRLTHSLKSTSANIGAIPISEQAKQLEDFARAGRLADVSAGLATLKRYFELTKAAIESLDVISKHKTG